MNNSLKKIQDWRARRAQSREQRSLKWWERERANGKTWFVIRSSITSGLTIIALTDIFNHLFGSAQSLALGKGVFFTLFGIFLSLHTWSDMESKYKKALNEARAKAPVGDPLPHDNPS